MERLPQQFFGFKYRGPVFACTISRAQGDDILLEQPQPRIDAQVKLPRGRIAEILFLNSLDHTNAQKIVEPRPQFIIQLVMEYVEGKGHLVGNGGVTDAPAVRVRDIGKRPIEHAAKDIFGLF